MNPIRNNFFFDCLERIDSLQIYTEAQALEFQDRWQCEIDYLRFEWVALPGVEGKTLAADLVLRSEDGKKSLIVIGILAKEDGLHFPSLLQHWRRENIAHLCEAILAELVKPVRNCEIRALYPAPRLPVAKMTIERVLPGMRDYTTTINHIKRYTFLLDRICPGKILECACGTGYGAAILSRLGVVTEYYGVDLSEIAVTAASGNTLDKRLGFHRVDLADPSPALFENVISLETIEHVPNPYRFMELLIARMAPEGQLLLSLPAETWGGTHLNPFHFSNWNRARLMSFLSQYFEEATVYAQRLSLLGPTAFEASEIADGAPDEDSDECFVCILRRPKKARRPAIILKRLRALGDVIWTTPLLRALRRQHPRHNLIVVTEKTEAFMRNSDADLVMGPQYEPFPDDIVIDLDWVYERRRDLHPLDAYADVAKIPLLSREPCLYPSFRDYRVCADLVRKYFKSPQVEYLLAVHMQATSPDRIWPQAYWKQLLERLLREKPAAGIIIFGHNKDFNSVDIGIRSDRILDLTNKLDLMRSAAALSFCDLLIAPDSGVLHIAAAMQTPVLGLFSMVDPAKRLPFSARHRALWADIECRGCLDHIPAEASPRCPLGHAKCMEKIRVEDVFGETDKLMHGYIANQWRGRLPGIFSECDPGERRFALKSAVSLPTPVIAGKIFALMNNIGANYKYRYLRRLINESWNRLMKLR